jgi:hypothetical protein
MTANGSVYTWGKRDDGRLGYDTYADQVGPRLVDAMRGLRIQQVGVCASVVVFNVMLLRVSVTVAGRGAVRWSVASTPRS